MSSSTLTTKAPVTSPVPTRTAVSPAIMSAIRVRLNPRQGLRVDVRHLFDNSYRVNVYEKHTSPGSMISGERMVDSSFVHVDPQPDGEFQVSILPN